MATFPSFFLFLLTVFTFTDAHNITEILSHFPEYTQFNNYLTQTKLADDINSRTTITVLVLNDGALSSLTANHPLSVIKAALSLHVLLDYWDGSKLHDISKGTTVSTTLYQTTGNAAGNIGFVNITDLKGGKVGFGSAVAGSHLDSQYTKSVKQIPYNISVIEIDKAIIAPGILDAPAPGASGVNLTAALEKAGCKTFAGLLVSSGVMKTYQTAADNGLTVFAPNDAAFKDAKLPDLTKLSNAELVALLQFHAVAEYTPMGTLKATKHPISTLATSGAGKYDFSATTAGDAVTLDTGVDSSRVASTVLDSTPLCIFTVDNVLLPTELFGKAPSPAPVPAAPEASPASSPEVSRSPTPAPKAAAAASPTPMFSPPAPPTSSPAGAPVEGPVADSERSTADKNSGDVNAPALLKTILTVSVLAFASVYVS
ncbi:PREDICTED: fasciclin-like arabinogalactan protein 8 [Ipomoea nil]|uniref:fasciclin-like arabinogalactan protein 8 n=1 Tax=Ipomoea nil TaxID=35883 RepID=UPI000901A6D5|nr:PREDICTED: fasciclin-like arabinogalactan protein 8 [Ipomoea nil]